MNKREYRGIRIFFFSSILVLLIGIVMKASDKTAYGRGGGRYSRKTEWILLTGDGVIILGVLLLVFAVFLYFLIKNEQNK